METLKEQILEELEKREKGGWWELDGKRHPFVTAGALYLFREAGIWRKNWDRTANELLAQAPHLDLESLRMVLLLSKSLSMDLRPVERRLEQLFDKERGLWRVLEGLPGDPLTSSAMLVAMWLANHNHPLRERVLDSIKKNYRLPEPLADLIGGQRPVLTSLYRALALSLHSNKKEARKIWNTVKRTSLKDLPPKYLLEKGMKEDEHYPAVLAAALAASLGEKPEPYLEVLQDFKPERWDNARLVTIGFYLHLLQKLLTS